MVALRIMLAWLLVVGGSPVCAQTAADPRALIGEWSGLATQISPRGAGSRGPSSRLPGRKARSISLKRI